MKKSRLAFVICTMLLVSIGSYYALTDHLNFFVVSIEQDTDNAIEVLTNGTNGAETVELSKAIHFIKVVGSPQLLVSIVKPLIFFIILLIFWLFLICIYYEIKLKKSQNALK